MGERRAVALGLDQRVDDATDGWQIGALGEVLQGLATVRQKSELDRGEADLVGQVRRGEAQLAGDTGEGGVHAEAGFRADDQEIEPVRDLLAQEVLPALDGALEAEDRGK